MSKRTDTGVRSFKGVKYNGVAYMAGQVGEGATIQEQTTECLRRVDALLTQAGLSRAHLLCATIWRADMSDFDGLNDVWSALVSEGHAPNRAYGEAKLARPELEFEIIVDAACG